MAPTYINFKHNYCMIFPFFILHDFRRQNVVFFMSQNLKLIRKETSVRGRAIMRACMCAVNIKLICLYQKIGKAILSRLK